MIRTALMNMKDSSSSLTKLASK